MEFSEKLMILMKSVKSNQGKNDDLEEYKSLIDSWKMENSIKSLIVENHLMRW